MLHDTFPVAFPLVVTPLILERGQDILGGWRSIYTCTLIFNFRLKQVERKVVINLVCLFVCIKSTYLLKNSPSWRMVSALEF